MTYPKLKPKTLIVIIILLLAVMGSGLLTLKFTHKSKPSTSTAAKNGQGQATPKALQQSGVEAVVETNNFKYQRLKDWVLFSNEFLNSRGAISGIGRPDTPVATFLINVSSTVPSNTELKNAALDAPKKLANFQLLSSKDTKVDGQSGQQFIYTFGDKDKTKQEMNVIIYKQKTYFLLFSSTEAEFDKSSPDFAKILASFTFK